MGGILGVLLIVVVIYLAVNLVSVGAGFLFMLISAGIAGYLASRIMKGDGLGILGNVLLGFVGAVVGDIVLSLLNINFVGDIWIIGNILVGVVGGVIVIFIARALGRGDFGR